MYWLILVLIFILVFLLTMGFFSIKEKIFFVPTVNGLTGRLSLIIGRLHLPFLENLRSKIKKQLSMAGVIDESPDYVLAGHCLNGMVFSFLGAILSLIFFDLIKGYILIGFFVLGFILSVYKLKERIKKRHCAILRALPDVLDILTVAVEAGLDFNAALIKLIELEAQNNPLVKEIFQMQQEVYVGSSRIESLYNMAARVDEPGLSAVCSSLIQAIKMGTSLGPILRLQSEQIRVQRFQKAEKLAGEAPVKMLFPLIFLILPTVFLVLFVPLILTYISSGVEF
ncbi:type II secretion system F family protein [bacterium]|nr:type II secretion system F family protein [bacterium]